MPNEMVVCYLVNPPGTPLPLSRTREITIGRDSGNRITLPYHDVSRWHAKIYWKDQKFILEDLNSANGTMVNGSQVASIDLKDGDQITIGNHALFFYEGEPPMGSSSPSLGTAVHETIRINTHESIRTRLRESTLHGDVKVLNQSILLQILGAEQKTGCLCFSVKIGSKTEQAKIFLHDGKVIHAEFGDLQGTSAFFAMMDISEGNYEFHNAGTPLKVTLNHPVEFLLLEYARQMDERERQDFAQG